jgi:hypothetical protein
MAKGPVDPLRSLRSLMSRTGAASPRSAPPPSFTPASPSRAASPPLPPEPGSVRVSELLTRRLTAGEPVWAAMRLRGAGGGTIDTGTRGVVVDVGSGRYQVAWEGGSLGWYNPGELKVPHAQARARAPQRVDDPRQGLFDEERATPPSRCDVAVGDRVDVLRGRWEGRRGWVVERCGPNAPETVVVKLVARPPEGEERQAEIHFRDLRAIPDDVPGSYSGPIDARMIARRAHHTRTGSIIIGALVDDSGRDPHEVHAALEQLAAAGVVELLPLAAIGVPRRVDLSIRRPDGTVLAYVRSLDRARLSQGRSDGGYRVVWTTILDRPEAQTSASRFQAHRAGARLYDDFFTRSRAAAEALAARLRSGQDDRLSEYVAEVGVAAVSGDNFGHSDTFSGCIGWPKARRSPGKDSRSANRLGAGPA